MANETGFSTAEINSLADDAAWRILCPLMQAGRPLRWYSKTQRAYVDGRGGLTMTRVRKLVQAGVIREAGLDAWMLTGAGN